MTIESPYKFLDSYTEQDRDIFFGRDLEIEEVYKKVFQGQTLFIYGESGTGKSSLISCGLANRFKKSDWLPVKVRRGENINQSLLNELDKLVLTRVDDLNGSFSKNLYKYTRSLYLDYFKPVYFIFDQFEELYLLGTREEWREFILGIKALTQKDLNVHFIFIIRSEYLHFLSEFEEELPGVFNNKIRIEKITRQRAKECIEGPCNIFNIEIDDDFSDELLDRLSPDSIEVELTYLQVYLDQVYKMAVSSSDTGQIKFSKKLLEDIGLVSDVLSDFLDEQIGQMADQETALTVLKGFVTTDGTKRQTSKENILSFSRSLGEGIDESKVTAVINELLERRILKDFPDQNKFELRHDALANKIFQKITFRERELIEVRQFLEYGLVEYRKRKFLLTEKDLSYIEPHLPSLDLTGETKDFVDESSKAAGKKRRRHNRLIGVISIIALLSVTSIYGFFDAQRQGKEALQQKTLAEQNSAEAQTQRSIALQNESRAVESQRLAELNSDEAQRQAEIAEQQRYVAELQKNAADSNRTEAEKQKLLALIEKDSAESARARALVYLKHANDERAKAERLSMQTLARSLGIKSPQLPDITLKTLLAYQAYLFNREYDGYVYQADIHNALYQAYKAYHGADFNLYSGHTNSVQAIVVHDEAIYSTGSDGLILRWTSDMSSHSIFANTGEINYTLTISSDGNMLAAGGSSGSISIYNIDKASLLTKWKSSDRRILQLGFNKVGHLISTSEDRNVKEYDIQSQTDVVISQFEVKPSALAINPFNDSNLIALENGKVYSIANGKNGYKNIVHEGTGDPVTALRINERGTLLALGFKSGSVQLVAISGRDKFDFSSAVTLPGHTARVSELKFSKDGRFLVSAGYDRKNLLWSLKNTKEPPITWSDHDSFVLSVVVLPSGNEVATGEIDKTIKKYRIDMDGYAEKMCAQVDRNLLPSEWSNFVRDDIAYRKTCENK
jgi:WD40 repeat protein/energy-coupling factor transporter ATP-binding protein EcfA2